jgi:DNA end-binding protein Ku
MPRPYWSGYLRLSLVSCPIYLTPATTERETIRLNQINPATGNRIRLQPIDADTKEPVERATLVKGYEIEKGQYLIFEEEELEGLKIDSSRVLELSEFVDKDAINPLYFDAPYFVYPENASAVEAYKVIAEAVERKGKVALGRVTFGAREHPAALQPYGGGLLMSTLRTEREVREAEYDFPGEVNEEMVEIAASIIDRMAGSWKPAKFHDRYQDALRELIAAKSKGYKPKAQPVVEPQSNVIDLMAALKRSLAQSGSGAGAKAPATAAPAGKSRKAKAPTKQASMLLPVAGGRTGKKSAPAAEPARKPARRKRA